MKTISITWSTQDVLDVAEQMGHNITEYQADYILDRIKIDHDACIGINWDVIEGHIESFMDEAIAFDKVYQQNRKQQINDEAHANYFGKF